MADSRKTFQMDKKGFLNFAFLTLGTFSFSAALPVQTASQQKSIYSNNETFSIILTEDDTANITNSSVAGGSNSTDRYRITDVKSIPESFANGQNKSDDNVPNSIYLPESDDAGPIEQFETTDFLQPFNLTVYNFSSFGSGLRIMFGSKQLNVDNLQLTFSDAVSLLPYLHGETLQQRMYVWSKTALLYSRVTQMDLGTLRIQYDISLLDKIEGDMIFSPDGIDRLVEKFLGPEENSVDLAAPSVGSQEPNTQIKPQKQRQRAAKGRKLSRTKRKMTSAESDYWSGPIPWKIDDKKFAMEDVEIIKEAIRHWESLTCIRFQDITDESVLEVIGRNQPKRPTNRTKSPEESRRALTSKVYLGFPRGRDGKPLPPIDPKTPPHLQFKRQDGCHSYVGKTGSGQPISIGPGCETVGIVAHEIGHAIGFFHEQDRPDRDLYVRIHRENLRQIHRSNFDMRLWEEVLTNGIPYDYSSLMHYSGSEWALEENDIVIEALDSEMQPVLGQRTRLSFYDVKLANDQFCSLSCRGKPSLEWAECLHGGYRNPNSCNECLCPEGWGAPYCQNVETGRHADCQQTSLSATQDPSELRSPTYVDRSFHERVFCAWHITAPTGSRISLTITEQFRIEYDQHTCEEYLEVRYKSLEMAGPRLCSTNASTHSFTSYNNEVLLLFYANPYDESDNKLKWFNVEYQQTDGCGGCTADQAAASLPVCTRLEMYECNIETPARINNCYRDTPYCCSPYQLHNNECKLPQFKSPTGRKEPWGPWSEWTACTATCGGCGWRSRDRACLGRRCRGDNLEWERCNMAPCPVPVYSSTPAQCEMETLGTCLIGTRRRPCIKTAPVPCPGDYLSRTCCLGVNEDPTSGQCV